MVLLLIKGLTLENYDQTYLDENGRKDIRQATRYFIYAQDLATEEYCRIKLDENHERQCCSGWTNAAYGIMEKESVPTIPPFSYVPKVRTALDIDFDVEQFDCDLFTYSDFGADSYYPTGYVKVNMENFLEVTNE